MYSFVDTTEVSDGALLPAEALKINGKYIENLIPGYRTLSVSGREALSPEIETYETGIRDGSTLKSKRYPERIIIVKYQLIAEDAQAFRAAYNKLGGILDVEEAELIFNDETDKFFIGTPAAIGEVEPGRNAVIGEIEFICADPFKYSVEEYEAEPQADGNFLIEYNGTYKSYPKLVTEFYKENEAGDAVNGIAVEGDCGFVAFFNEDEKIIQMGDPDETDGELGLLPKAQTLVNQNFCTADGWGAGVQSLWAVNSGITSSYAVEQAGTVRLDEMRVVGYEVFYVRTIQPNSYGSGEKWHGPSITRTIPADASGITGAANFCYSWATLFCPEAKEIGAFQTLVVAGSGSNRKIVAGVQVYKGSTGMYETLRFYINNKTVHTRSIHINPHFDYPTTHPNDVVWCSITKSGNKVTFSIGTHIKETFTCTDADFANLAATEITYTFSQFGTQPPVEHNGVYGIKFVKNNCSTWKDVPNKFSVNDVLIAECETGEIYHNNAPAPELGALANDWESFYLKPGINQIGTAYSIWLTDEYKPTFKLKYREVFR